MWIDTANTYYTLNSEIKLFAGAIKTTAQLKEVCEKQLEFARWINDRCYYFYNKDVGSFDDAQKICSDTFKQHGFENGKLYEPRNAEIFVKIYRLAEDFSQKPTIQLWLGLNDKEKENEFVYSSNGKLPEINAPWGGNLSNSFQSKIILISYV